MRILVSPHELSIGGSQINAIDLAVSMRDRGHDVIVYGIAGPLASHIETRGLRFSPAHASNLRPAPQRIVQLMRLARAEQIDLIHAYEWPPCLDAYYGAHLLGRVPLVCTVLSMTLSNLVPESIPLIMGTRQLQEDAQAGRGAPVFLLEPPIDTEADHPSVDGTAFMREHRLDPEPLKLVIVSRLSTDLKLDSLERAVDVVASLPVELNVCLVIVGGGEAFDPLSRRAAAVNARMNRRAVVLTGPLLDPRPAYAAADVVLGMGSSILRAMAFGKPALVQGEAGFSEVFTPQTADLFLRQGFFGVGDGRPGVQRLQAQLQLLLTDAERRRVLGAYSRRFVEERFSLGRASDTLERIYHEAVLQRPRSSRRLPEAVRLAARAASAEVRYHLPEDRRRKRRNAERLLAASGKGE